MAFTPKTWADGTAGGTPVTAAELNRMEQGIDTAVEGSGITAAVKITQADYDALATKDATTLYVIV